MHASRHRFPMWLLCILIFVLLVALTVHFIPSLFVHSTPTSGGSETVEDITIPQSTSAVVPAAEDRDPASGTKDQADVLQEEDAPYTEESEPEPIHIHSYNNGICSVCGERPVFYTDFLPEEFYSKSEHPGTVELHEYRVTAYANWGEGEYDKCFNIYLPYNYDDSRQYDVLVLIHGGGGDQDSWLNTVYDYGDIQMRGRDIFDHLFEASISKPCILICPVMNTPDLQGVEPGIFQMRDELREYILPYVAEHYSTYAKDASLESLRNARDHFALAGFSNGALFVYEGGMRYNFDLFASYAAFSGNYEPWLTASAIRNEPYSDLPIRCLFTGAGTDGDWQQEYTETGFQYLVENDTRLTEGETAFHVDVSGGHEWKLCFTDICNALPLMFP